MPDPGSVAGPMQMNPCLSGHLMNPGQGSFSRPGSNPRSKQRSSQRNGPSQRGVPVGWKRRTPTFHPLQDSLDRMGGPVVNLARATGQVQRNPRSAGEPVSVLFGSRIRISFHRLPADRGKNQDGIFPTDSVKRFPQSPCQLNFVDKLPAQLRLDRHDINYGRTQIIQTCREHFRGYCPTGRRFR